MLIQEISAAGLFFLVWGLPNVFDGFPILGYNIWANSRLCFADLNTIEPREVEWQFSQSNSSSSCNRISYFLTLDLFQGMMQMDMACAIFMKMQWYAPRPRTKISTQKFTICGLRNLSSMMLGEPKFLILAIFVGSFLRKGLFLVFCLLKTIFFHFWAVFGPFFGVDQIFLVTGH